MLKWVAIGGAALMSAVIGVTAWYALRPEPAICDGGSVAGAAIGGPFTLISETGETVTEQDVIDGPALVYFGYTFCPDVCPFDAERNATAVDLLAERGFDVKPVFVTVDPSRDTPEVLAEYTDFLHPQMLGLTGSDAQIREATKTYKVFSQRREGDDPDYYFVDHTALSYLMVPDEGLLAFFRGAPSLDPGDGISAEQLADTAACHLESRGFGRN